jgi:hypothetical protein
MGLHFHVAVCVLPAQHSVKVVLNAVCQRWAPVAPAASRRAMQIDVANLAAMRGVVLCCVRRSSKFASNFLFRRSGATNAMLNSVCSSANAHAPDMLNSVTTFTPCTRHVRLLVC